MIDQKEFKGTKGEAKPAPRSSAVNIGSLRVNLIYPSISAPASSVEDIQRERELADKELICEAFNIANETNKTPRQLLDDLDSVKKERDSFCKINILQGEVIDINCEIILIYQSRDDSEDSVVRLTNYLNRIKEIQDNIIEELKK